MVRLLLGVCSSAMLLAVLAGCSRKDAGLADAAHALSLVAAEEAAKLAGAKKQVVVFSPDSAWKAAARIVADFETAAKKRGLAVVVNVVPLGDPMAADFGLKAADFFAVMEKSPEAGVVVSFAGAPLLKPAEFQRLPASHPPILVIAIAQLVPGERMHLARLLDAKIVQAAIIDGVDPAAPIAKSDASHTLFAQTYRILR